MKKFFYTAVVLVLLIGSYLVVTPKSVRVETAEIQRGLFEETLTIEGKIRSRDKRTVYAYLSGNLENLPIKLGDTVTRGQVLTHIDGDWRYQVKSPITGVISKIVRESAGPVIRGEPLFEVSNLESLEVVAEVLTPDVIRLSPNGQAKILNWGGEGELPCEIVQISRAGMVKTSALGVEEERTEVRLGFKNIPPELTKRFGDNYHVDVVFMISRDTDALIVPLGALFKNGDQWAVYLAQQGRAQLREIKLGKKSDRQAIVLEGLKQGDLVILYPGDKIHQGSRIRS